MQQQLPFPFVSQTESSRLRKEFFEIGIGRRRLGGDPAGAADKYPRSEEWIEQDMNAKIEKALAFAGQSPSD